MRFHKPRVRTRFKGESGKTAARFFLLQSRSMGEHNAEIHSHHKGGSCLTHRVGA